ncbi:outer membrane protein [Erythrobacter sp. YT30]|uniref:outer membrane protein n=1 Tax=Erythrobacter sp. YT30 TaxID=1735012 RepID=UPI00076D42D9|nr:outer membrane beta-barrel protein [Erythrobacter sp. YT30]KWV91043.1 hypothetical protein AUC45_06910 [Erythrobacter sp. YT30]
MRAILLVGAASLGLVGTSVSAQDLSGLRIEGRLGWDQVGVEQRIPDPDEEDDFLKGSGDDDGVAFGGEIGYDAMIGDSLLIGAYAGVDFSDNEICNELIEDDLACTDLDRTFSFGLRAGVPIGGTSLIYAKGGYSIGSVDAAYDPDVTDNGDDDPGEIAEFSDAWGGFHAGAGIELGFTDSFYGKVEYVYTDFGTDSYEIDEDIGPLDIGVDRHQVMVGVGLRF